MVLLQTKKLEHEDRFRVTIYRFIFTADHLSQIQNDIHKDLSGAEDFPSS